MLKASLDPCSMVRVQTWDSQASVPSTVEPALRIAWPTETGACVSGRIDILCIGPTDWLVIATDLNAATLLRRVDAAFKGSPFRATDVSQALTRIEIDGPNARALLAKGCSLDLHPPGRSARARFAGMPVIVRCLTEFRFECIVILSYGEYLLSWLTDAAAEFSGGLA